MRKNETMQERDLVCEFAGGLRVRMSEWLEWQELRSEYQRLSRPMSA